mmetsp:Transcript_25098/g.44731  ORF Transcript_25098/g.44731 Transcript_25098/m.44731 type:complete len:132 (-) Transcript_25098:524-919(-)
MLAASRTAGFVFSGRSTTEAAGDGRASRGSVVLRTNRTSTVVRRPPRNAHRLRHVGDPARQRSRHTTGRCTALPAAQDVACLAVAPAQAATEEAGLALLFAKLSGTALSAGAILLFSPIIVNLLFIDSRER